MREFFVEIGGKSRRVRYTSSDGRALYRQFEKPLNKLFMDDVLGLHKDPSDGRMRLGGTVNPEAQFAVLMTGLKHDQPSLTDEMLDSWIDAHLDAGLPMGDLVGPAVKAAYFKGVVTGRSLDLDEIEKNVVEEQGKGPEPAPVTPGE